MKLRLEESDTVFQVDDIEPFPQTIADAILRMLAVAEAANPAIVQHEVLLELEYMRRGKQARDRRTKATPADATIVERSEAESAEGRSDAF